MPKRQNTTRVPSTELQGEDSFVVFRKLSWGLVQTAMQKIDEAPKDENGNALLKFTDNDAYIADIMRESIAEWNWVDNDDKPMPTPAQGLPVGALSQDEMAFLFKHATGFDLAQRKNSS